MGPVQIVREACLFEDHSTKAVTEENWKSRSGMRLPQHASRPLLGYSMLTDGPVAF